MLVNGMLGWGVTTGVVWTFLSWLSTPNFNLKFTLSLALVLFPIGGLGWGWYVWRASEQEFLRAGQPHVS